MDEEIEEQIRALAKFVRIDFDNLKVESYEQDLIANAHNLDDFTQLQIKTFLSKGIKPSVLLTEDIFKALKFNTAFYNQYEDFIRESQDMRNEVYATVFEIPDYCRFAVASPSDGIGLSLPPLCKNDTGIDLVIQSSKLYFDENRYKIVLLVDSDNKKELLKSNLLLNFFDPDTCSIKFSTAIKPKENGDLVEMFCYLVKDKTSNEAIDWAWGVSLKDK